MDFFRADGFMHAISVIKSMVTVRNPWILFDDTLYNCGLDRKNFNLMLASIGILFIADLCKYKGICIRKVILQQEYWFRWIFFSVSACAILLFGIWGSMYNEANFIYFQF